MTTKTRKEQTETSRILDAVHETARDLHTAGFISKRRMKDYEALRLVPVPEYTAEMALVEVVRRRLIEHRRNQLADEIQEAQRDLPAGYPIGATQRHKPSPSAVGSEGQRNGAVHQGFYSPTSFRADSRTRSER